jgi:hypothetical protein
MNEPDKLTKMWLGRWSADQTFEEEKRKDAEIEQEIEEVRERLNTS